MLEQNLSYAGSKIYVKKPKNLIGITGTNGKVFSSKFLLSDFKSK